MSKSPIVDLVTAQQDAIQSAMAGKPLAFSEFMVALRAAAIVDAKINRAVREDPGSVIATVIECAQLGLRPGRTFKQYALIPREYKGKMTLQGQVEYRGLIRMALDHNEFDEPPRAEVVWKGETFRRDKATQEIVHKGSENELEDDIGRNDDDIIGAYAICRIRGREKPISRVVSRRKLEHYRAKSDSYKGWLRDNSRSSPWVSDFEAMCKKTAMRRLLESGEIDLAGGVDLSALQEAPEEIRQTEAVVVESDFERRMREPFPSDEQRRAELTETVLALGAADQEAIDAMETAQLEELVAELRADGVEA